MRIEPPHEEDLPHRNVRGDYRTDNNEGSESVEDLGMPELQEDSDDDEPEPRRTRTTRTAHTRLPESVPGKVT